MADEEPYASRLVTVSQSYCMKTARLFFASKGTASRKSAESKI